MKYYFILFFLAISVAAASGQKKIYTKISVRVDTLSTSWKICVHDSTFGLTGFGIKGVVLMDGGDCYPPCPPFFNSHIDGDTNFTNQILYSPPDTEVCFSVSVYNIHDSCYAPIFIYDSMDQAIVIKLHYYPPKNSISHGESESFSFSILPNPVSGNSLVFSLPTTYGNAEIIIYDILGREVLDEKIASGISQTQLSIASLRNGIYYARFVSGHFKSTQKFEIER